MYGVSLAIRVSGDAVSVNGVVKKGSCEPLEISFVGVEWGPSGLDEGGDHIRSALLYRSGYS